MLRLRYARWLLEHSERSVTEIALEAGFSDCAHFSRHFKAVHGASPSEVRAGSARSWSGMPGGDSPGAAGSEALAGQRVFG